MAWYSGGWLGVSWFSVDWFTFVVAVITTVLAKPKKYMAGVVHSRNRRRR